MKHLRDFDSSSIKLVIDDFDRCTWTVFVDGEPYLCIDDEDYSYVHSLINVFCERRLFVPFLVTASPDACCYDSDSCK